MKVSVDTDARRLISIENGRSREVGLYTKEAFEIISKLWLTVGWNQKHLYTFTWLGRPIIQLPDDMMRIQEVIYRLQPDVILETGIAHGGSLIFYASLCRLLGKGRVIGVDIEIRPHNRKAMEDHFLSPFITLVEGDSVAGDVVNKVKSLILPGEKTLVILDSAHHKEHVAAELEAYCGLVQSGFYIVATDGSMRDLYDTPRGKPDWKENNPAAAARDFERRHPEFEIEQPAWLFNESGLSENITHWPDAWLKRK
ncbi:MAG: CmcI family methyltransferase [Anaerolineales bacterium]